MYRFLLRPKWLGFHLLCIFGVVLMVYLSFWQFHRLDERKTFNNEVRERSSLDVVDVRTLDTSDPEAVEWRPAGAKGTYLPNEQVLIVNRSQGGFAGMNVLTPLLLDDGRAIIINRGFIALNATHPRRHWASSKWSASCVQPTSAQLVKPEKPVANSPNSSALTSIASNSKSIQNFSMSLSWLRFQNLLTTQSSYPSARQNSLKAPTCRTQYSG
jgi:cytochrome oxidase assembly protein ShyY1